MPQAPHYKITEIEWRNIILPALEKIDKIDSRTLRLDTVISGDEKGAIKGLAKRMENTETKWSDLESFMNKSKGAFIIICLLFPVAEVGLVELFRYLFRIH